MIGLNRTFVVGASRGLGKALVERLERSGVEVIATIRQRPDCGSSGENERIATRLLDLADPDAGDGILPAFAVGSFDAVVMSAGIFGPAHQDVSLTNASETSELFWTNAVAPVRLARKLLPLVRPGGTVAFLSSRTGSITLNEVGDLELYRASKAALNSLTRSFAVKDALPRRIGVLLLHPGWVQTDMGGSSAPVTVLESVAGMHSVLVASLDRPAHRFVDYRGKSIEW